MVFAYGNFVTILINFVMLAFVIFWMVKAVNRVRARLDAAPAATPEDVVLLREIRDELKQPLAARRATVARRTVAGLPIIGRDRRQDVCGSRCQIRIRMRESIGFSAAGARARGPAGTSLARRRLRGGVPDEIRLLPVLALALAGAVQADINVGVTLSATGPAASLGIPAEEHVRAAADDDRRREDQLDRARRRVGHDARPSPTRASLLTENKVDVIIGSSITPNSLAMVDVVADAEHADDLDGRVGARSSIRPIPKTRWVFKTPQSDSLMADAIAVT